MKLAKREKYFLIVAVVFIGIFIAFQSVIFPFFEARRRIQKGIKVREDALEEIVRLRGEFQSYKQNSQDIKEVLQRRQKGFTLFSFLENAAGAVKVKNNIKYMKPSSSKGPAPYKQSSVEMKLELISLKQLIDYLYRIESFDNVVGIKRISIKENKQKDNYLDVVLQVVTFE